MQSGIKLPDHTTGSRAENDKSINQTTTNKTKIKKMNYRLQLHKERLEKMLQLIYSHEIFEETWDFDESHVKKHEEKIIMEYCAEFAALNQLAFNQIKESKATISREQVANPVLERLEVAI